MKTVILNAPQIERILRRIAYQLVETCYEEKGLLIVGIKPRGQWVAHRLIEELQAISKIKTDYVDISAEVPSSSEVLQGKINGSCVILVDDIVNSGLTMMQAATVLMNASPKRLVTACLVDRKHRLFPVLVDFTGLSLATTMQEHLSLQTGSTPQVLLT